MYIGIFSCAEVEPSQIRRGSLAKADYSPRILTVNVNHAMQALTYNAQCNHATFIRAKVEHPFHVVKNLFQHSKARYKGLAKNTAQLFSLFGFANLLLARRWLLRADRQAAS